MSDLGQQKNVISRAIYDIIILWRLISILDITSWDLYKYKYWMTFFYILYHIYIYIYIYIRQLRIDHDKKDLRTNPNDSDRSNRAQIHQ